MKKVMQKFVGLAVTLLLVLANSFLAVQNSKSSIEFKLGENVYAASGKVLMESQTTGDFCCCPGDLSCAAADCGSGVCTC